MFQAEKCPLHYSSLIVTNTCYERNIGRKEMKHYTQNGLLPPALVTLIETVSGSMQQPLMSVSASYYRHWVQTLQMFFKFISLHFGSF